MAKQYSSQITAAWWGGEEGGGRGGVGVAISSEADVTHRSKQHINYLPNSWNICAFKRIICTKEFCNKK